MFGASAGQFGVLSVSGGNLTLGSGAQLSITLAKGFDPVGNTYTILTDAGGIISGTFANAAASGFQMGGVNWTVAYNSNNVILDAVSLAGGLITATWNTGSGHWTTATEWSCTPGSPNCLPNNNSSNIYAAVLNSAGNTLTLDGSDSPKSITINTLSLQAGTLDIGSGATLNLVNQPNGITDIRPGAGLDVAGTFEVNGGPTSALANLGSVEGTLTLEGQTLTATPGSGTFSNSGTVNLQQTTALTISGNLSNSGIVSTGNGGSDTGNNSLIVTGTLTNNRNIFLDAAGDSLSVAGNLTNTGSLLPAIDLNGDGDSLTVGGTLTNDVNASLTMSGANDTLSANGVTNSGDVNLDGNGDKLTDTGSFVNNNYVWESANTLATVAGDFTNNSGAEVRLGAGASLSVTGTLANAGEINMIGAGASLRADLTNSGAINLNANSDTLTDPGDFNNNSGGSLSLTANLDSVSVSGNFNNNAGASVTLSGTNGSLTATNFANGGTVTLSGVGDTLEANVFTNTGTVTVGTGEKLNVTNAYTQTGGATQIQVGGTLSTVEFNLSGGTTQVDGTLGASGGVRVTGGTFEGTGRVNGNVAVSGTGIIHAGDSPGILTINGNYNQSGGTLLADITGAAPGTGYSQLIVSGTALLGGTLDVSLLSFSPTVGEDFFLLTSGEGDSGNFGTLDLPSGSWSVFYNSNNVELQFNGSSGPPVTPEPGTLLLYGTGLLGVAGYVRRKRAPAR